MLKDKHIDTRDTRIIINLYWNQKAVVRIENETTEEIEIKRGVRQGCILSPLLFNLYSEAIFKEALSEDPKGIVVNGKPINNIRYADDTVILAENIEDLQSMVNRTNQISEEYGLKMNLKKTKLLIFSKSRNIQADLVVDNNRIERIRTYTYLGTRVNDEYDQSQEIRTRIEMARGAFLKMRRILCNRDLSLELRTRILRTKN